MSWRDLAECRGLTWWCQDPPQGRHGAEADAFWERRRRVCARCPVTAECLEDAVESSTREWMWGGLTPSERRGMQRRPVVRYCKGCGAEFTPAKGVESRQKFCSRECKDRAWERSGRRVVA